MRSKSLTRPLIPGAGKLRCGVAMLLAGWTCLAGAAEPEGGWKWPAGLHGYLDARAGVRTQSDPVEEDSPLHEIRAQLEFSPAIGDIRFQVRGDLVWDGVAEDDRVDLEEGTGPLDLREAYLTVSPLDSLDVKIGRQILTWGTGDLLFINDLFPKDWNAFFIGRDIEYLKAPSDALMASWFSRWINLDLVYTPRFDPDRFIDSARLSAWSPMAGRLVGRDVAMAVEVPDQWFQDDETALRLSHNLAGYELSLYGYEGRWKSPAGFDPVASQATFPRLSVWGASVRGTLGQGIGNLEAGTYESRDDAGGINPLVPNSELRVLAGYERELIRDLNGSVQYYAEIMRDYQDYRANLPEGMTARDEVRQVATIRLTAMALSQNLVLSLFAYYSPSDRDGYVRPVVTYRVDDHWTVTGGANWFEGEEPATFFGQFENNNNVYASVRYGF